MRLIDTEPKWMYPARKAYSTKREGPRGVHLDFIRLSRVQSQRATAAQFGVSYQYVSQVLRRWTPWAGHSPHSRNREPA